MKILYIGQYFPPEMGAPSARVDELSREWAARGHDVQVLTAFAHHPTGRKSSRDHWVLTRREMRGRVKVLRSYVYAAANAGFTRRIASYLSFMASAIAIGGARLERPDVLIATSPQFFVGVAGMVLAQRFGCPFVFEVRDLWPQSIVEVGAMRRGFAIRQLERLEGFLYRRATHIITVADNARRHLIASGVSSRKVSVVPNGVDLSLFTGEANGAQVRRELGLSGQLVIGYFGTHGMAHGLDSALEAASQLRGEGVHFLLVGEGSEKARLRARTRELGLDNVTFLSEQPKSRMPELLAASDVGLVIARRLPVFRKTIPSKLFEVLGARRPVLLSYWGETEDLVRCADCGVIARPERPDDLVNGARALKDPALRERLALAGRLFVERFFSRAELARRYEGILEAVAHSAPTAESGRPFFPSDDRVEEALAAEGGAWCRAESRV